MAVKKNILFFFVHPSKFHLFRYTINELKNRGHRIDVAIISKDILEDLVKSEGWEYINIFPEGRRSRKRSYLAIILTTFVNFFRTLYRLHKITSSRKYDLYVTDDCLVVTGWYKSVRSIFFIDNELSTVPEMSVLMRFADIIIAPECVNIGKFESKKAAFKGYKELAYLSPEYFNPDSDILKAFNPSGKPYAVIRLVAMTASHDRGINGITKTQLETLIYLLSEKYLVFISSETGIEEKYKKHILNINPEDIIQVLYHAEIFIGDSGTMASEAAVLGTPSIMIHDFIGRLAVMSEKENKYGIMFGFRPDQFDMLIDKLKDLLAMPELKTEWKRRRNLMLGGMEDVNKFIINIIDN